MSAEEPVPELDEGQAKIADVVASSLRRDLTEFTQSLRVDILNDVKELIAKTVVPQVGPSGAPPGAPQIPQVPQSPPADFSKMNKEQIAAHKDQQFMEMVKVFAPLLLQQQQNPMIQEMLNRILMDQVAGGVNLQRAMLSKMLGDYQGMQQALASQQYIHQVTGQPVFNAAAQGVQQAQQAAAAGQDMSKQAVQT